MKNGVDWQRLKQYFLPNIVYKCLKLSKSTKKYLKLAVSHY